MKVADEFQRVGVVMLVSKVGTFNPLDTGQLKVLHLVSRETMEVIVAWPLKYFMICVQVSTDFFRVSDLNSRIFQGELTLFVLLSLCLIKAEDLSSIFEDKLV